MADADKLISDYITTRRFAKDKLFKTGEYYLGDMARRLEVPHCQTNLEYCERIIKKLIIDYNYFGEYNSGLINLFLNLHENAHKGSIPDSIKLYDLELKIPGNNQIANILAALNRNTNHYYVTQDDNNKFKRKSYNEQLVQRVKDIEQHLAEQKRLREIELQKRMHEIEEQSRLRDEQRQQEETLFNNTSQNDFLANKEMTEPFPKVKFAHGLDNLRRQSIARMNGIKPVDLHQYQEAARNRQRPMQLQPRTKKNKLGITGMDDLIRVVVNLKNDVKQIRDAQSVESAQDWIERKGYQNLYDVVEEDLDDDGYPEVVVKDKSGKKVIVNGYTTEPSLFPYRRYYYANNPTKAERKNNPWRQYVANNLYKPTYDETGRTLQAIAEEGAEFDDFIGSHNYSKRITPKNRSSYQAFSERCVAPFYKALKYLNYNQIDFKQTQLAGYLWREIVRDPALTHVYGANVLAEVQDQKELAKICKAPEVKEGIENIVVPYLTNPISLFEDIVPVIIDKWREAGYAMGGVEVRDFILASRAIIENKHLPNRAEFEAWKQHTLDTNPEIAQFVEQVAAMHEE